LLLMTLLVLRSILVILITPTVSINTSTLMNIKKVQLLHPRQAREISTASLMRWRCHTTHTITMTLRMSSDLILKHILLPPRHPITQRCNSIIAVSATKDRSSTKEGGTLRIQHSRNYTSIQYIHTRTHCTPNYRSHKRKKGKRIQERAASESLHAHFRKD
jgi:hypothetical protein